MYDKFIADRLAQLRHVKEMSARDMSLSMGQNENYINQIENQKMLPSMQTFFYICEFLEITPQEFFDEFNPYPERLKELIEELKKLDAESLSCITGLTKLLNKK
ncbi:MAG: helix-turn-helix domain-containing protein [Peptococcaceae bacterium]|nr:helix-turn-helix domain-containing protein [Peptococcaceae bacterium]